MHLPLVAFPLFLQTHYIRNIAVFSCFMFQLNFYFIGKRHPLWSSFQENDPSMFSHSQHAGTCILLCTLPHSPLTLSFILPSHTRIYIYKIPPPPPPKCYSCLAPPEVYDHLLHLCHIQLLGGSVKLVCTS